MSVAPNLTLISEVMPVLRRDFTVATPAHLIPTDTNPYLDGEWLGLNSTYQVDRGSGEQASLTFPIFSLRGQYDTQAIGKVTLLFGGCFEAETLICDTTGLSVGNFLVVNDVTVGGLTKQGLKKPAGAGQHWVVGIVTRLPGGGKVRFWHDSPTQITI